MRLEGQGVITFGGVDLLEPDEKSLDQIERQITLRDVYQFAMPGPGFLESHLGINALDKDQPIELGTLFWPVGASRWASFHGVVNGPGLEAIRAQLRTGNRPLPFVMADGSTLNVTTNLWMLPPRPLARTSESDESGNLWLVTFVDERFWWWTLSADIPTPTTWTGLFSTLGTAIGHTITVDTIAAAYLDPSEDLRGLSQPIPVLLDMAAASVGQRVVRFLDGTVKTQGPVTAKTADDTIRTFVQYGGGKFKQTANIDPYLGVPGRFSVVFPKSNLGVTYRDRIWESTQTPLSALGIVGFNSSLANTTFVKSVRSTALAWFDGSTVTNAAQLNALANQTASDWYRWHVPTYDMTVKGAYPWTPSGFYDLRWRHQDRQILTRLSPLPLNDNVDNLIHSGSHGAFLFGWGGDAVHKSITDWGMWITPPANVTLLPGSAFNATPDASTWRVRANAGLSLSALGGLAISGLRKNLWNVGANNITVPAATVGGTVDFSFDPGVGMMWEYDAYAPAWRAMPLSGGGSGGGNTTNIANSTVVVNGGISGGTINNYNSSWYFNSTLLQNITISGSLTINNSNITNNNTTNTNITYVVGGGTTIVNNNSTFNNTTFNNGTKQIFRIHFTGGLGAGPAYPWSADYALPGGPTSGSLGDNPVIAVNMTQSLPSGGAFAYVESTGGINATYTHFLLDDVNGTLGLSGVHSSPGVVGNFFFRYSDANIGIIGVIDSGQLGVWANAVDIVTAVDSLNGIAPYRVFDNIAISPNGTTSFGLDFGLSMDPLQPGANLTIVADIGSGSRIFMDHPYEEIDRGYGLVQITSVAKDVAGWAYTATLVWQTDGGTLPLTHSFTNSLYMDVGAVIAAYNTIVALGGYSYFPGIFGQANTTTYIPACSSLWGSSNLLVSEALDALGTAVFGS